MKSEAPIVISASRRTDIPAFYMNWFMGRIDAGFFEATNPYNKKISIVPASPEQVHTIVFWSKDFGPFIEGKFGNILLKKGYRLYFNFTVNSENRLLEPNVPPLNARLKQMSDLCALFGAERIQWRFDPVCFFMERDGRLRNNLNNFDAIAGHASDVGIPKCITSFMDDYKKIRKRTADLDGFLFIDPPIEEKIQILLEMEKKLIKKNIILQTCCEKEVINLLPKGSLITQSSCIPNKYLVELSGGRLSFKKDTGQRIKNGCGCMVSSDIGLYDKHPCFHNCLFCYANPAPGLKGGRG